MATLDDLMRVTGLCRTTTKQAVRNGELPGYKVGARYVIPDEAFDRFCRGDWTPTPRPVTPIAPITTMKRLERAS
jgi:excisionase family DNA binding protein